jgi:hypothetical protein
MAHRPFGDGVSLLCLQNISTMRRCVTHVHQRQTQEPVVAIHTATCNVFTDPLEELLTRPILLPHGKPYDDPRKK